LTITAARRGAVAQAFIVLIIVTVVTLLKTWLRSLQVIAYDTVAAARFRTIISASIGLAGVAVVTFLAGVSYAIAADFQFAATIAAITFIDVAVVTFLVIMC
jgi:hypothetical protein